MNDEVKKALFGRVEGNITDFSQLPEADQRALDILRSYGYDFELKYDKEDECTIIYCINATDADIDKLNRDFMALVDAYNEVEEMEENQKNVENLDEVVKNAFNFVLNEVHNYESDINFDKEHPNSMHSERYSTDSTISLVINSLDDKQREILKELLTKEVNNSQKEFEKNYITRIIEEKFQQSDNKEFVK
jgi:hypothetical protein